MALFELRQALDMTQTELASELKIKQAAISKFKRDSRGMEVDLGLYENRVLRLAEIKAGRTYDVDFARSIRQYRKMLPSGKIADAVLYAGTESPIIQNVAYLNFSQTATWVRGE
jgi:transcriptional regulator with XRE-family HTH domain